MLFKYTLLNFKNLLLNNSHKILYADFNVLNFLYENNIIVPDNFLLYPDSTAVFMILRLKRHHITSKLVSTDFQEEILVKANQLGLRVFFFGDEAIALDKLQYSIANNYPNLVIAGINSGYNFLNENVIDKINISQPDILFVGLGVGRQEPWILENADNLNVRIIISVGGWFKFLAGIKKRAPLVFRKLHLEWFYKILTDFRRLWKRYLIGVPKFFYRVLSGKINFEFQESNE